MRDIISPYNYISNMVLAIKNIDINELIKSLINVLMATVLKLIRMKEKLYSIIKLADFILSR